MNKIDYKIKIIGGLERDKLKVSNRRDKLLADIQELGSSKAGIDQQITMLDEQLNREYLELKTLLLKGAEND